MIKVNAIKTSDAHEGGITTVVRVYLNHDGLDCKQMVRTQDDCDFPPFGKYRISRDNGRTYGDWVEIPKESTSVFYGNDEAIDSLDEQRCLDVWNPVHRHYVSTYAFRYFINGHVEAYEKFWSGNKTGELCGYYDHQYIRIRRENEDTHYAQQFMMYEDGVDFDENNPRNPEYLTKNRGYVNPPVVLKNGDIIVVVSVPVSVGCARAGLDVNKIFPSRPDIFRCVIVARGRFDTEKELYDFTYSEPIILSDLQSSRGIDEPTLAELEGGRIVLVMRGSNMIDPGWNTRIEKGTPAVKWFAYSDDGAKSFTQPQPWHFDNGEFLYSSATISDFIRLKKSGKLYWIGNVVGPGAYGNHPRYPLCIAEIDEKLGVPIRSTLTTIDTRREGDAPYVQLSNFWMLEDRETGRLEISLAKVAQFDVERPFYGEGWRYELEFDD